MRKVVFFFFFFNLLTSCSSNPKKWRRKQLPHHRDIDLFRCFNAAWYNKTTKIFLKKNILQALGDHSHQLWEIYKSSGSREGFTICLNILGKTRKLQQPWGSKQWAVLPLACILIANESKRRDWAGYCPCQMQSIHCSGNLLCFDAHFPPVIFFLIINVTSFKTYF